MTQVGPNASESNLITTQGNRRLLVTAIIILAAVISFTAWRASSDEGPAVDSGEGSEPASSTTPVSHSATTELSPTSEEPHVLATAPPTSAEPDRTPESTLLRPTDSSPIEFGPLSLEWESLDLEVPDAITVNEGTAYLAYEDEILVSDDLHSFTRIPLDIDPADLAERAASALEPDHIEWQSISVSGETIAVGGIVGPSFTPDRSDPCATVGRPPFVAFATVSEDGGTSWTETLLPRVATPEGRFYRPWEGGVVATDGDVVLALEAPTGWINLACILHQNGRDVGDAYAVLTDPDTVQLFYGDGTSRTESVVLDELGLTDLEFQAVMLPYYRTFRGAVLDIDDGVAKPVSDDRRDAEAIWLAEFSGTFVAQLPTFSYQIHSVDGGQSWDHWAGNTHVVRDGSADDLMISDLGSEMSADGGATWEPFHLYWSLKPLQIGVSHELTAVLSVEHTLPGDDLSVAETFVLSIDAETDGWQHQHVSELTDATDIRNLVVIGHSVMLQVSTRDPATGDEVGSLFVGRLAAG